MAKKNSTLQENILIAPAQTNRNPSLDSLRAAPVTFCRFVVIKNLSATLPAFITTQSLIAEGLTQGIQIEPLQVWTEHMTDPAELAITTAADAGAIVSVYAS